ncbi:MAG: tetratricopeptide repeat protein [Sphingomonadaceae bacterium]
MALPPENSPSENKPADDREAAQQDVFMREVDDALREDELKSFLDRYGKPLAAAIVLGLAGLGGWLWWQDNQEEAAGKRGEAYVRAVDELDAQNLKGADERLAALAEEGGGASAVSANLLRAGIALEQDRAKDAVKLYEQVAADTSAPQPYRDLATVRAVSANFDAMKPEDVVTRLKPLAVKGNPWFGVAGELLGMAYLKQGKEDLAGPLFAQIARDEDLPDSLRGRARQLSGLLGVDAVDDVIGEKDKDGEEAEANAEDAG